MFIGFIPEKMIFDFLEDSEKKVSRVKRFILQNYIQLVNI
jgi:tRNA A22 N-methylase